MYTRNVRNLIYFFWNTSSFKDELGIGVFSASKHGEDEYGTTLQQRPQNTTKFLLDLLDWAEVTLMIIMLQSDIYYDICQSHHMSHI